MILTLFLRIPRLMRYYDILCDAVVLSGSHGQTKFKCISGVGDA